MANELKQAPKITVQVRTTRAWLRWLDRASGESGIASRAGFIGAAVTEYAKSKGLTPPPVRV
jgi:hypothetical protein